MPSKKSIAALAIIAPLAAVPGAGAAPEGAKLVVSDVTDPPETVAAGGTFDVRATLRNRGSRTGRGRLRMTLIRGPQPFQVGRVENLRVRAGGRTRVTIRLTAPGDAPAAGYRLRTCVRQYGATRSRCVRSRPIVITGPAPEPTPEPTAAPTG